MRHAAKREVVRHGDAPAEEKSHVLAWSLGVGAVLAAGGVGAWWWTTRRQNKAAVIPPGTPSAIVPHNITARIADIVSGSGMSCMQLFNAINHVGDQSNATALDAAYNAAQAALRVSMQRLFNATPSDDDVEQATNDAANYCSTQNARTPPSGYVAQPHRAAGDVTFGVRARFPAGGW